MRCAAFLSAKGKAARFFTMTDALSLPLSAALLLPHAPPMLCLDRLVRATDDEAEAEVLLRQGHILLNARGRLESCGMVELAAQCAGAGLGYARRLRGLEPRLGFLVEARRFAVTGAAGTGDLLRVTTARAAEVMGVALVEAAVYAGDRRIASGQLKVFSFAEEVE